MSAVYNLGMFNDLVTFLAEVVFPNPESAISIGCEVF